VLELLRSAHCAFLVVAAPVPGSLDEAGYFVERLADGGMRPAAVVVNRRHPAPLRLPRGAAATANRLSRSDGTGDKRTDVERGAVAAVIASYAREEPRRAAEAAAMVGFAERHPEMPLLAVPELPGDVQDVAGLRRIASHLFRDEEGTAETR